MTRSRVLVLGPVGLVLAAIAAHYALIETSGEVVVLRTEAPDGVWHETRLWIVDEGPVSWLHGGDSNWVQRLRARPVVEVVRGGAMHRYRATPVPGPHARVHELLRARYGLADRWVRWLGPDDEATVPIRLERLARRADGPS